jgi:hypothetical protein
MRLRLFSLRVDFSLGAPAASVRSAPLLSIYFPGALIDALPRLFPRTAAVLFTTVSLDHSSSVPPPFLLRSSSVPPPFLLRSSSVPPPPSPRPPSHTAHPTAHRRPRPPDRNPSRLTAASWISSRRSPVVPLPRDYLLNVTRKRIIDCLSATLRFINRLIERLIKVAEL